MKRKVWTLYSTSLKYKLYNLYIENIIILKINVELFYTINSIDKKIINSSKEVVQLFQIQEYDIMAQS